MKAGAFTPATLGASTATRMHREPLNEGGGFHPRNPWGEYRDEDAS